MDKNKRGQWVWICIGIIFLLALIAPIVIPYFATKPLTRDQLMHYHPNPPQSHQSVGSPSPAASPGVKKR